MALRLLPGHFRDKEPTCCAALIVGKFFYGTTVLSSSNNRFRVLIALLIRMPGSLSSSGQIPSWSPDWGSRSAMSFVKWGPELGVLFLVPVS